MGFEGSGDILQLPPHLAAGSSQILDPAPCFSFVCIWITFSSLDPCPSTVKVVNSYALSEGF